MRIVEVLFKFTYGITLRATVDSGRQVFRRGPSGSAWRRPRDTVGAGARYSATG